MKKNLLACMFAFTTGAFAQVGPPLASAPNSLNGYSFTQSTGSYIPLSNSKTIWQTGVTLATDAISAPITLPSLFAYNGKSYSSIVINNNGYVTFGTPTSASTYTILSSDVSPAAVEAAFAGFAVNLKNANTTTSEISYESVGTKFIVQFTDLMGSSASATQLLNFQIQLDFSDKTVKIVYGNCVSGSATLTAQVGIRGSENSDTNNRTGTNWTASTVGTSNSSSMTLGITNANTVPASGLTFTFTPGTWLTAIPTYATMPFTENFSNWANGNSTLDLPNANNWRTWPARGDNSWRQSTITAGDAGFASTSGWTNVSGGSTIAAPAVAPAARFHSYNCQYADGYMDLYVNLSNGSGTRIVSFDYLNPSGSDVLKVQLSTDGGATFTDLGSLGVSASWSNKSFTIGSFSATAIIRFLAKGDNGTDDIYVDNVNVSDYTLPLCTTVTAPAVATGVSITPVINWTPAIAATSYVINLGTTPGGTDVMNGIDVGNVTTYTVPTTTPLNYSQIYYLTVKSKNTYGNATGCVEKSFTTINIPCPTVSAPSASSTGVSIIPTFTWAATVGATGYKISIGTTVGGTDILNEFDLGNVTTYTYSSTLAFGTKYYYTIKSYNSTLTSTGCTERNFTTSTLCPAVTAPANSSTSGSITPNFTWTAITGATGYKISMGTTAGGTDVLNDFDMGNVTSYTHNIPLAFSTKYYYRITGYSGTTLGTACTERNFTTQSSCPVVTYPAANATLQPLKPTINWNAISTATYYTLTVGTTAGGADIMNNVNLGNVTSYTFTTPLTLGAKYYYTVNTNLSTGCAERNFTLNTIAAPSNDNCSGAILASNFPFNYSQTDGAGSTNGSGFISTCTGSNDGLWFKLVGDGGSITVSATNTTSWDHRVSVYSGTCGNLTCVGTVDDQASSVGYTETYTFSSTIGTEYYVNVAYYSSSSDSAEGNFNLNITSSATNLASSEVPIINKENIKVYPNPFADVLSISDIKNVKSVSIIDIAGRLVKTIDKPSSQLQLSELKSGMYIVILNMNDGSKQTIKAIKK